MKVIIQIPSLNGADALPLVLAELPHRLSGVPTVE
jgi:hypothetical protein